MNAGGSNRRKRIGIYGNINYRSRQSADGDIVASYGNINVVGYGTQSTQEGLYAPYDAKVIGDYTGITPPFGFKGKD